MIVPNAYANTVILIPLPSFFLAAPCLHCSRGRMLWSSCLVYRRVYRFLCLPSNRIPTNCGTKQTPKATLTAVGISAGLSGIRTLLNPLIDSLLVSFEGEEDDMAKLISMVMFRSIENHRDCSNQAQNSDACRCRRESPAVRAITRSSCAYC